MAKSLDTIRKIIEQTVRERFEGVPIASVDVAMEEDIDGDAVITVKVVFENSTDIDRMVGARAAGLVRHVRSNLAKKNEYTFPIVRMMHKRDAELL